MTLLSTKKFGPISTSHRNWRAAFNTNRDSRKCSLVHGYSRYLQLTFSGNTDDCGWVYDFGDCKFIKSWLEDYWDHRALISSDDPKLKQLEQMEADGLLALTVLDVAKGWNPGIEGSCKWVYDCINPEILSKTNGRVSISKVEIWEHEFNTAVYIPSND